MSGTDKPLENQIMAIHINISDFLLARSCVVEVYAAVRCTFASDQGYNGDRLQSLVTPDSLARCLDTKDSSAANKHSITSVLP